MQGLIGRKIGMSQVFTSDGQLVPVTVIQTGPCTVVQKKTVQCDGYAALQLGFGTRKAQRTTKPVAGHCKASGTGPFAVLREFRSEHADGFEVGATITVGQVFQVGDRISVVGRSKGRGFTGVMKRHGMAGFPASHGTHETFRHGGAIGNRSYPGRVFKGKRMAGHSGDERVTVRHLQVIEVRPDTHMLLVKGAIPGARNGMVLVRKAEKK